ncbi:MAG: hypothetical protein FH756_01625 [Firmicutes bacterium]|nr:hypothetical protein [Bacillota bacterium]
MNKRRTKKAAKKALSGKPLTPKEQRAVKAYYIKGIKRSITITANAIKEFFRQVANLLTPRA